MLNAMMIEVNDDDKKHKDHKMTREEELKAEGEKVLKSFKNQVAERKV